LSLCFLWTLPPAALTPVVQVNNVLRQGIDKGLAINNLMENWDFLQLQCALYINSETTGVPQAYQTPGKPLRGLVQRLKGKQGRFRGNLSGVSLLGENLFQSCAHSYGHRQARGLQRPHRHLARPQPAHQRGRHPRGHCHHADIPRARVQVRSGRLPARAMVRT
jgi:hypothetical protein